MTKKPTSYDWLKAHVNYDGAECLIWPFGRNTVSGRGQLGCNGRKCIGAHRVMCELVNGSPPTPKHQASHSCGRGHDACVHPLHLSWATNSQNQLARRRHGTANRDARGRKGKLTAEQVQQIRALKGKKTQVEIAAMFGVGYKNVGIILRGQTWKHVVHSRKPQFTGETWR